MHASNRIVCSSNIKPKIIVAVASALLICVVSAFGESEVASNVKAKTATPSEPAKLAISQAVPYAATPLPLADVRLTGGPLKKAQELDAEYLLKLEPDRMLYYLRLQAGMMPKGSEHMTGWDGAGRQLTGHIAGHYLSAISYMYAATGEERFKERVDYIVNELRDVQNRQGDGYIGALLGNAERPRGQGGGGAGGFPAGRGNQQLVSGKTLFEQLSKGIIRSSGFDLNGMWSPWYVEHKLFAGLRDAYRITGNQTALEVEKKFAGWVESVIGGLDDKDTQKMLDTEFGGMNEVLADLYADTGDQRWLKLSDRFFHKIIIEPLSQDRDILGGKHGNTLVPKLLGNLKQYVYTGDSVDGAAARFFWTAVVDHHSFATGGHGYDEYFGPADKLNGHIDGTGQRSNDLRTAESCNVYNMLKMTRELFALAPDVRYADFQERALFNHVLGSIDPKNGWTCYMVPVGQGVQHEYERNMTDGGFTCCVGTGMENHALHGFGIYYADRDRLWVTIYAPTTAHWKEADATIDMETSFPQGEDATLKVSMAEPREFTLSLRRPGWAGKGFVAKVNGEAIADQWKPDSFVDIKRTWKTGDTVTVSLPKSLHMEGIPDNPNRVALMWGPLVLAGDLGPEQGRRSRPSGTSLPAFVTEKPITDWLVAVDGEPGNFQATTQEGESVKFSPFYALHERKYGLYWDVFTPAEWEKKQSSYASEQEKARKLAAATVSYAQPGEMQPERDYNFQAEDSTVVRIGGQAARRGTKWFSFDLPVDDAHPMTLVVTYSSDEAERRTFELRADGELLTEQSVEKSSPSRLFDVEYKLPEEVVKGKKTVTIKFQATRGNEIGAVCGVRIVRADAER
jgi:DUF1680 family protein